MVALNRVFSSSHLKHVLHSQIISVPVFKLCRSHHTGLHPFLKVSLSSAFTKNNCLRKGNILFWGLRLFFHWNPSMFLCFLHKKNYKTPVFFGGVFFTCVNFSLIFLLLFDTRSTCELNRTRNLHPLRVLYMVWCDLGLLRCYADYLHGLLAYLFVFPFYRDITNLFFIICKSVSYARGRFPIFKQKLKYNIRSTLIKWFMALN